MAKHAIRAAVAGGALALASASFASSALADTEPGSQKHGNRGGPVASSNRSLGRPSDSLGWPAMDPSRPVLCVERADGDRKWRVQCDDRSKTCLWAPDGELDSAGAIARDLERARPCLPVAVSFLAERRGQGYRLVRGLADAPHGWERDERGRVIQVNFDLKRRLYLGASWAPRRIAGAGDAGRAAIDFGLFVWEHVHGKRSPTRHRLRLVEGEARLAPYSGELVVAHYDLSRRFDDPLLRITTFFGRPRRTDVTLHLGAWLELGSLELHRTDVGDARLWRLATAHATLDLWQSADLESYARVRGGVGVEGASADDRPDRTAITPGGALESDLTLDRRGFHHVGAEIAHERPRYLDGADGSAERTRARIQYELIVLAINDQPLSLVLSAGAERRDDIPGLPDRWALTANAGLRFSLWAPPRAPW